MKKLLLFLSIIALLTACGNKPQNTDNTAEATDSTAIAEEVKPQVPLLITDSIGMDKTDEKADVSVIVDWPTEGDEALIAAVREYICKTLSVKMTTDGKAVVKTALQNHYNETASMWEEAYMNDEEENEDGEEESGKGPCYMYMISIRKVADTDKFVTYLMDDHTYYGGAHGSSSCGGITFSKATAKTVGYKMEYNDKTMSYSVRNQTLFNDKIKTKEFNALLKAGLKDYFSDDDDKKTMTDAELAEMLMDEQVNKLPLPGASPHFTDKGLEFVYQQYEIAAYCYGMPTFVIPFDKVKPYLTGAAMELIPEK